MHSMAVTRLFCEVDDFVKVFETEVDRRLLAGPQGQRRRATGLSTSERMTLLILFHRSGYRCFKNFYVLHVCRFWREMFPKLVSYNRFVNLLPRTFLPLWAFVRSRFGKQTGIAFVDSTRLAVCHTKRIPRNRVFGSIAQRGKTTMGWFYGFKLHLVINDRGEFLGVNLTAGNVDDRKPVEALTQGLSGKLFGDKGYISQKLFESLLDRGLHLVTNIRKRMKNRLLPWADKILLRKRFLIETVNDQLKNVCQIEHTRHRSPISFLINLAAGLIAYTDLPKKPSLRLPKHLLQPGY